MIYYFKNMEFIDWVDVSIDLIGDLPNLPMPLAIKSSIEASKYLLQDIKQWKYVGKIKDFDNDSHIATLEQPKNATVYEVEDIYVDGIPYTEYIKTRPLNQGHTRMYKALSNTHIQFSDDVDLDQRNTVVEATLIPSKCSEGLAKSLFDQYNEGIKYKCLEIIYKSPYPTFFNPEKSSYYRKEYDVMKRRYLRKPSLVDRDPPITSYGGY